MAFARGYLRFARFLNINGRQWPLMLVNVLGLLCSLWSLMLSWWTMARNGRKWFCHSVAVGMGVNGV